ncbi:rhodanese-like domain-containing protein [Corynebacterium poyangense]|uniref:Rhodanese-like domain-containing protein n=1 Tax=Corynebacterium poyangense TaxID=2684405 RepID=A0A7H0SR79_9CORY|nr:rhodanese-like domain-containing protein [Corynebacterium poyangense]MBZ8176484.1 rhodanese-like domain-containing protein [Corynebacterium poyangense]QNQ91054.1 rhodanese-like domain-containing protein [Corynebacterium poyangense]
MKICTVHDVPSDAQLIDVREPDEYQSGHAQGARSIPMSEFTSHLDSLDTDRDIYVICKSGGRSAQVAEYLDHATQATIYNVDGGTDAWKSAGLPME